jgi:hypothetical protein
MSYQRCKVTGHELPEQDMLPLVKLGQGDTETEYTPAMFAWTEYVMGIVTGMVVVGLLMGLV